MKYFPLVWAGLWRKPTRSILTFLSVSVAFVLFGMLHGVSEGFTAATDQMSDTRIRVQSKAGILTSLPLAHLSAIEQVEGVSGVGYFSIFAGYYQEPTNPISGGAIKMDRFFQGFPDVDISEADQRAMAANRRGAIIGHELAEKYGWKRGDTVSLSSSFWMQEDGSRSWEFEIVGMYKFKSDDLPSNEFWTHYEYLDESRDRDRGTVHLYFVTIDSPEVADRVTKDIDELFLNTAFPTISQNEKEWLRSRLDQVGNIEFFVNAILGAVLFTLLFLTGNTMMQSVRERVPELAVLRTYGFSNTVLIALVLVEAAILCAVAAGVGLVVASFIFPTVFEGIGFGAVPLSAAVFIDGVVIALILALLSCLPPAIRAQRLNIVDALAGR